MSKYYNFTTKFIWQIKSYILVICLFLVDNNALAAGGQASGLIEQLIENTERQYGIPSGLLAAIAQVESGMNAHAVNVEGKPIIASSSHEAFSLIDNARDNGISNIDVGVMQINYRWHSNGFVSTQEMLNPRRNIEYAAVFLVNLKKQHGTWYNAIKYYHSSQPEHQRKYSRKVVTQWGRKYV